jgi:hypothetical protein
MTAMMASGVPTLHGGRLMSLIAGPVSFSRFRVAGGSPKRLDDALLEKLRGRLVGARRDARPDGRDTGWIGGRHLLDREFDIEKNVILDCLHFGLRIDGSQIPSELMYAYVQMELVSLLKERRGGGKENGNEGGRSIGSMKKQAKEAAARRAELEIKEGRYRRMRQASILWDTRRDVLYFGATVPAVQEELHPVFRETFGKRLEPVTAGSLAQRWAEEQGASRRLEGLKASTYVPHPSGNGHIDVYWTAHDASSHDFLGNEFLLWLWYVLAERSDTIELPDATDASVLIVKQLMLECPWAESGKEVISCDGPTRLPESRRAIHTGKLPRRAGLIVSRQGDQYEFILQAETLNVTSAVLPRITKNGNGHGRAQVEERVEQVRHLGETIDLLYFAFLRVRLSDDWQEQQLAMQGWLKGL